MKYRYLSYIIEDGMPAYGGRTKVDIISVRSLKKNDSCNVSLVTHSTHCGTHIDLPRHFCDKGPAVCDYPAKFWFFQSPRIIELSLKPSEILRYGDWCNAIGRNDDIILFRSLWARKRASKEYSYENPGIHPEVAEFLRKRFPKIRAVGLDWVSVSPYQDRAFGRLSHKAFLSTRGKYHPIAIIEGMDLSCSLNGLKELIVIPVRVKDADSSSVTVIGVFRD